MNLVNWRIILCILLIGLSKIFSDYLSVLYQKKYITEENRFIRDRKINQKEYTAFILSQRSCTGYIETIRFFY